MEISLYSENSYIYTSNPLKITVFTPFLAITTPKFSKVRFCNPFSENCINLAELRSALPSAVTVSGLQPRHFNLQYNKSPPTSSDSPKFTHFQTPPQTLQISPDYSQGKLTPSATQPRRTGQRGTNGGDLLLRLIFRFSQSVFFGFARRFLSCHQLYEFTDI